MIVSTAFAKADVAVFGLARSGIASVRSLVEGGARVFAWDDRQENRDAAKKEGAIIIDPADIATLGKFDDSESMIFKYELKADLNAYLARLGLNAPVKTLKDIIEFNEKNRQKEMPYFGQDFFIKSENTGPLTEKEYLDALAKNHQLTRNEGIDAVMDKNNLEIAALIQKWLGEKGLVR